MSLLLTGLEFVENVMALACRAALARKGVAHVTMPVDMQSLPLKADTRSERNVRHHVSMVGAHPLPLPSNEELKRAASILKEGKKPCILAGRGALCAH